MDRLLPELDERTNASVRDALRSLGGRTTDPGLRDLVDDVLAGRRPIIDVARAPVLQREFARGVAAMLTEWEAMDPAERQRLVDRET